MEAVRPFADLIIKSKEYIEVRKRIDPYHMMLLLPSGADIIVDHYKKKYPEAKIKILVITYGNTKDREKLDLALKNMEDDSFLGLSLYKFDSGSVHHVLPYLYYKKDGVITIFKFENSQDIMIYNFNAGSVKIGNVNNYSMMQVDGQSCSVFSLNTLKCCFLDDQFLKSIKDAVRVFNQRVKSGQAVAKDGPQVSLRKTKIAQHLEIYPANEENAAKYLQPNQAKSDVVMSFKAFKEGHEYALIILQKMLEENAGQNGLAARAADDKAQQNFAEMARKVHFARLNEVSVDKILELEGRKNLWKSRERSAAKEKRITELESPLFKDPKASLAKYKTVKLAPIDEKTI